MLKKKNPTNIVNLDERRKKIKSKTSGGNVSILNMASRIDELKTENQRISEMAARTILKALDAKDNYTYGHSMRVCYYSMVLGEQLGFSEEQLYELQLVALFHDIGKIGTPDAVLNKPTRLSDEEFKIIQEHPSKSFEILQGFEVFNNVAINVKHHHERYDGRGYPDSLKGEAIPQLSRIILIADTFDAMTSSRIYRKALNHETAFNELIEFSGSQFDPGMVKNFIIGMRKESAKDEDKFYVPLMQESFVKDAA